MLNIFQSCSSLAFVNIGNGITNIEYDAFEGCKLHKLLIKSAIPPTFSSGNFSELMYNHTILYVPIGCKDAYAYHNSWYKFINIFEAATTEEQLSAHQAYSLMDASTFDYSVYDPVNKCIATINSTSGIDENNPNHSWQTMEANGMHFLYNIGARKYVTRKGNHYELKDSPEPIEMEGSDYGIIIGSGTAQQWALVSNERMSVVQSAIEEVAAIGTTVDIKTSNAGYATFFDSRYDYALPDGLSAQVVTNVSNGKLTYKVIADGSAGEVIPKGTAVMLTSNAKHSGTFALTATVGGASYSGTNLLHGSDEATTTTGNGYHYKLSYGQTGTKWDTVFGWYWGAQNGAPFQIDGHKAWLVVPSGSTRAAGFSIDGDATEITDIESSDEGQDVYYDIHGRRIATPTRSGLYIKNGKKVIIK